METNQSDQINMDLSPTEWREKFILISQEEYNSPDKIFRMDVIDEYHDLVNENKDDNNDLTMYCYEKMIDYIENSESGKKLKAQHNERIIRLAPLFVNQPRFKKICEELDNSFVTSCFKRFECHSTNELHEQINNLEFIIYFCGSSLTVLNIGAAHSFNYQIMPLIRNNCPNLQVLFLAFKEIKRRHLTNFFSNMSQLQWLGIDWYCDDSTLPMNLVKSLEQVGGTLHFLFLQCFSKKNDFLPDSLALVFPQLIVLENLFITDFGLSQSLIESIGQMQNLVHIALKFSCKKQQMIDEKVNMYPIGNLKNLETLCIKNDCGVTDEFLINLCNNAEKLEELVIMGTNITDKGVLALGNLNELHTLDLFLNPRFSYDSEKKNEFITDKSIQYLLNEKLICLELSNCIEITNNSVIKLVENLPNLELICLQNTKVTFKLVEELISKLKEYREKPLDVYISFEDRDDIFKLALSVNVIFRSVK